MEEYNSTLNDSVYNLELKCKKYRYSAFLIMRDTTRHLK